MSTANAQSHIRADHYYWFNGNHVLNQVTGWGRYEETGDLPFINQNLMMNVVHESNEEEFDEQYSDYLPHKICPELHRHYGNGLSEMIMDCDEFEEY